MMMIISSREKERREDEEEGERHLHNTILLTSRYGCVCVCLVCLVCDVYVDVVCLHYTHIGDVSLSVHHHRVSS